MFFIRSFMYALRLMILSVLSLAAVLAPIWTSLWIKFASRETGPALSKSVDCWIRCGRLGW